MTHEKQLRRWHEAALDGSPRRIEGMLREMVQSNWPEYSGRFFLREYGLPTGLPADSPEQQRLRTAQLAADKGRYQDFVTKLYLQQFAGQPGQRATEIAQLRAQAADFSQETMGNRSGDNDLGWHNTQTFKLSGDTPRDFKVSLLNLNAGKCTHCTSTLATRSETLTCDVVRPDNVFYDRMDYFNTAVHELGHGLRAQGPDFRYDTSEEMRTEEGVAQVFAALMTMQMFGVAGMAYVREQVGSFGNQRDKRFINEAAQPLRAALDFATTDTRAFAALSPRALFDKAQDIVGQHDVVQGMSFVEASIYEWHLKQTPTAFNALANKVEPLLDPANWAEAVARHRQAPQGRDDSRPFAAATMFQVDAYIRDLIQSDLQNIGMRQNPLRPMSLRDYNAFAEDMNDPAVARDLQAFHARHNPSFCPPLAVQQVEYTDEKGVKKTYGEAVSPPLGPLSVKSKKTTGPL